MDVEEISVASPFGVTVAHRFQVHRPPSDRLLVILPGRAYLPSHPVLFHVGQMAWSHGFDVLAVRYGFQPDGDLAEDQLPLLAEDVRLAMAGVPQERYREVCVVAKSLGTPLALDLSRTLANPSVSRVLLTPVGPALSPDDGIRTLAVIGSDDPLCSPGVAMDSGSVTWRVFERLDHGLMDPADWRHSVRSLEAIVGACEAFLG